MKKSVMSMLLGSISVLSIVTTVYGGTAQDHLPHNTHKTMTPEEQKLAIERRISFDTRISRMKELIERAQAAQDFDERHRLLGQHMEEMQHGLAKIERMRHVRTNSDIQRRIVMISELMEQMSAYYAEQKRMIDNPTYDVQEIQQAIAKIANMKYVRTNADINRKVDRIRALLEQMVGYQVETKRNMGESASIQSL